MSRHRQLWAELNSSKSFYTKYDLALDLATAVAIAVAFSLVFMHEFNLF